MSEIVRLGRLDRHQPPEAKMRRAVIDGVLRSDELARAAGNRAAEREARDALAIYWQDRDLDLVLP